jgi:uncharacterized membrane protein
LYAPQRNYRTFLLFIYSTTLYIMWTFGVSLGMLFVKQRELATANPQLENGRVWLNTLGEWLGMRALETLTTGSSMPQGQQVYPLAAASARRRAVLAGSCRA